MSNYFICKGIWIRGQIVELNREAKNLNQLAQALHMTRDRVAKHCARLCDEGWMKVNKQKGWLNTYQTIRDDKYPEPVGDYQFIKKPKAATHPNARVFTTEYFDRIPGYFKSELRPVEHRGIGSSFTMMDRV
jgi:hypothetical protein